MSHDETKPSLVCRICLEDDFRENVIAPCLCSGTCKWIHPQCLNQWRASTYQQFDSSFSQCPTCKFSYRVRAAPKKRNPGRRRTMCIAFVARDCLLCLLAVFVVAMLVGLGLKAVDDSLAYCLPECQQVNNYMEIPDDGFIGPKCIPCSPFRNALFEVDTPSPIVYTSFGLSFCFAIIGFGAAIVGPRIGWRWVEPMVPTLRGGGKSHEAMVISAIAFFSIIGCEFMYIFCKNNKFFSSLYV